jgi:hypothetical protein
MDGYKEAIFFTEEDKNGWTGNETFSIEAEEVIFNDCSRFVETAIRHLLIDFCDYDQLGFDFWLTRNGQNAFAKRIMLYNGAAKILTQISEVFGNVYACTENDEIFLTNSA